VPYVICEECSLTTYSAALSSGAEECPHCGARLPVLRGALIVSLAREAALMRAPRAYQVEPEPAGRRERDDG
jgi:hypothetical protein